MKNESQLQKFGFETCLGTTTRVSEEAARAKSRVPEEVARAKSAVPGTTQTSSADPTQTGSAGSRTQASDEGAV